MKSRGKSFESSEYKAAAAAAAASPRAVCAYDNPIKKKKKNFSGEEERTLSGSEQLFVSSCDYIIKKKLKIYLWLTAHVISQRVMQTFNR